MTKRVPQFLISHGGPELPPDDPPPAFASADVDGAATRTGVTLTGKSVTLNAPETTGPGYVALEICEFPKGAIAMIGAAADLTVALDGDEGAVDAAWEGDISIGTAETDGSALLETTQADILPSTAIPAASEGATVIQGQSTASEIAIHDGTAGAKKAYLNILVDEANHSLSAEAACDLVLSGTILITWAYLGDYDAPE